MIRIAFLLMAMLISALASAQGYPNRPVRVIVTFPPGGTPDIYGRIMAAELQKIWNQPLVVENRTGAAGTIGTDYVAKAAPDGYTLLFAADAPLTLAPWLYNKLPYDPLKDFTPIVNVTTGPFVLLAHPSFNANNVRELPRAPARSSTFQWRPCARSQASTCCTSRTRDSARASPTCWRTRCRLSSAASRRRSRSSRAAR